jgi:small subunit ribosomal protein S20
MANTMSAKKNIRASGRKKDHNQTWKRKIREIVKSLKNDLHDKAESSVLLSGLQQLQKAVDKASKNKVIHKNKANRLKSMYARKTSALLSSTATGERKTAKKSK